MVPFALGSVPQCRFLQNATKCDYKSNRHRKHHTSFERGSLTSKRLTMQGIRLCFKESPLASTFPSAHRSLRDSVDACLVNAVDRRFSIGVARPLGLVVTRPYDGRAGTLGQDLDRGDIVAHG